MTNVLKDALFKREVMKFLNKGMEQYERDALYAWADEDALTQAFISAVSGDMTAYEVNFKLRGYKIRGRGPSAPESKIGADGIGIVIIETTQIKLRGFFLFQSKKSESHTDDIEKAAKLQCSLMLSLTAASQLLVLLPKKVAFVGAIAVASVTTRTPTLDDLPYVGFPQLVHDELLHGLMMAPIDPSYYRPILANQITNIITILIKNEHDHDDTEVIQTLAQLGFDDIEPIEQTRKSENNDTVSDDH